MSETDLQLGGGYTYQWECAILLALNFFYEPVRYNPTLNDLIISFLGKVEAIQLEGLDEATGKDLEDVNLIHGERRILIQVKTKQAEGDRWTLTDPLLLKALYRFYRQYAGDPPSDTTRFVFLTNRPFNPDLVEIKGAIKAGSLSVCAEAARLRDNLDRYAQQHHQERVDPSRFEAMLSRTGLVEFLAVEEVKANIQVKLMAFGRRDWEQAHTRLFEHFARQSTLLGGGKITPASLIEVLGNPPGLLHKLNRFAIPGMARDRKQEILLRRVQVDWIEDFLAKQESIYAHFTGDDRLIRIAKRWAPEMLAPSFERAGAPQPPDLEFSQLDAETILDAGILEIFDQAGSLLILGEPGSGKTLLLLELARFLADRASANPDYPVPVVLQLGSWTTGRKPLANWIVDELNNIRYGIARADSLDWLAHDRLSLLLDGLDEVPEHLRDDCVRAINQFVREHGTTEIAITCRRQEYQVLTDRLCLRRAIQLQDLTPAQVEAYLQAAGPRLHGLRQLLEADSPLREMAANPFMLYILSAIGENEALQPQAARESETLVQRRERLFDHYVSSQLKQDPGKPRPFSSAQTLYWLGWFAQCMDRDRLALYSLDLIQPSWLPSTKWVWAYFFASRLLVGLLGGLLGSVLVGLGLRQSYSLQRALQVGFIEGILGGLVAGLVIAGMDLAWLGLFRHRPALRKTPPFRRSLYRLGSYFVTVFAGVSLAFAGLDLLTTGYGWMYAGLQLGVLFGLCAILLFTWGPMGARMDLSDDIQCVERLNWTAGSAWRGALLGVAAGAFGGGVTGLLFGCYNPLVLPLCHRGFTSGDIFIGTLLLTSFFAGLIGFVFGGLGGSFLKYEKSSPDQGIRISLINALKVGASVGLPFATAGYLVARWLSGSPDDALTYALYGLFVGVLAALYYGGVFVLQQLTLRFLLWRCGCAPQPWRLVGFLDYAAQCIFLQRVGGAYRFFHRYLQDYFKNRLAQGAPAAQATPLEPSVETG